MDKVGNLISQLANMKWKMNMNKYSIGLVNNGPL